MGWIGRARRRVEDRALLTGGGRYVDDVQLPGALRLAVLRSPYPHARLRSVDVTAARQAPGVVAALQGSDTAHLTHLFVTPAIPDVRRPAHLPLAVDIVRYVGDQVAAVVAETAAQARDALDLIEVEYEPLPGVADAEVALRPAAPLVHPEFGSNVAFSRALGSSAEDVEAALRGADHIVSLTIRSPRLAPVALEPRTIAASFDPGQGVLEVWASTQSPFREREQLARALDLEPEQVHVVAPHVGGSFGVKNTLYRDELLAAYLARTLGRPVKWTATRTEDFLTTQQGRDQLQIAEAGFSRAGELQVLQVRIVAALGAYLNVATPMPPLRTAQGICGAYRVPVARAEMIGVFTNTPPTGPYRGAGRPEAALLVERIVEVAARELEIDPVAIRRRNFIRPDEFPWTTPTGVVYDSGDYARTLDAALELADYPRLQSRRAAARRDGSAFGIGLCTFVEASGGGGESGRVRVEADGSVTALSGSFAHGQGHLTSFAQVVADRLQIGPEQVRVIQGDTAVVPPGIGTFGSRSQALGGSAVARAAERVLEAMRAVASHLLEVPAADLVYEQGVFQPTGVPSRRLTFAEVARAAGDARRVPPSLAAGLDVTERFEMAREAFSNGCHIAAVSIDPETGQVTIDTYVGVDDAGVVVNPLLVEGQIHGGLAQGIGQALYEQMQFEADGTVLSSSLGDYSVARAADLPGFRIGETQSPSPLNPLGTKGVGEAGTVGGPPAVLNAVIDALGARHVDMPLTSEKVWKALTPSSRIGSGARSAGG